MIKWLTTCAFAMLLVLHRPATGAEFRVDTKVLRGGESAVLATHTSWLTEQRIYDQGEVSDQSRAKQGVPSPQTSVTVFDFERRVVVLLDPQRKIRTEIELDEILRFVAATTTRTTALSKLVRFASAPKFTQQMDEEHQRLYLNHKTMSYSAELLAPPFDEEETEQYTKLYRTFTDWAARLNTMCPGLPPAARLKLNLAIYEQHSLPKSVRRTTPTRNGLVTDIVSRHSYQWQFSPADEAQLATFDDWVTSFQFVDYGQFRSQTSAADEGDE